MTRSVATGWLLSALLGVLVPACGASPSPQRALSLAGTRDVSFVCVHVSGETVLDTAPLEDCPQLKAESGSDTAYELWALLSKADTSEVAVVNMGSRCDDGGACIATVVDSEPTQPGATFLPVGAEPSAIVSTPGGSASFVATQQPGKAAIFALPTTCIGSRPLQSAYRDLRTWPACRLPAPPGEMVLFTDRERSTSCSGESGGQGVGQCAVDLSRELPQGGRHKLAVSLPSLGQVAILDAQALLDIEPGSFPDCPIEGAPIQLGTDLSERPAQTQPQAAALCTGPTGSELPHPSLAASFEARPFDLAYSEEQLYVSDRGAPLVHVLSVEDACAPKEQSPLYPTDARDPDRVVLSSRLAVSPRTFAGERFLYAVDFGGGAVNSGTLMAFDVSAHDSPRVPIQRATSADPGYALDRIELPAPVSDVTFAKHDFPIEDPSTHVATSGVACDPDPAHAEGLGALYRRSAEGDGPHPLRLRGVFAFAALQDGLVVTIDVEDLDAPCRRPAGRARLASGCADDDLEGQYLEDDSGEPYVSDELSCRISEPHRPRLATFYRHANAGLAPVVRAFPLLSADDGSSLPVDQTDRGLASPRMLSVNDRSGGVDEQGRSLGDAASRIAGRLFINDPEAEARLEPDPAKSERNGLTLAYDEPRVFQRGIGSYRATYEGPLRGRERGRFRVVRADELALPDEEQLQLPFAVYGELSNGPESSFCGAGVEDRVLMAERGVARLSVERASAATFGQRYGDFVEVESALLPEDDPYWREGGKQCGAAFREQAPSLSSRDVCELFFEDAFNRELSIARAFNDRLLLEPRASSQPREVVLDMVECCFPEGLEFQLRAGRQWVVSSPRGFEHGVVAAPQAPFACVRSCQPWTTGSESRVFELSCQDEDGSCAPETGREAVLGPPSAGEVVDGSALHGCILSQHPKGGVQPDGEGSECVFRGGPTRFAIYRGREVSRRDMAFSWEVIGAVEGQNVDLVRIDPTNRYTSVPQTIEYLPSQGQLVVSDSGSVSMAVVGLSASFATGRGFIGQVAR